MSPKYKLYYYDARGRAEVCRLVMAAAGEPWEECLVSEEDWKTEKAKTPFGQLPVLEFDGKKYAQSIALACYLARVFGFLGKDNLETLKIEQVIFLGADLLNIAVSSFGEKDEAKKAERMKNFAEVEIPRFFALFENLLKESGTNYFVGNSLTLADIYIYDIVFTPAFWKNFTCDESFPLLLSHCNLVESHEKISFYLANRKPTKF